MLWLATLALAAPLHVEADPTYETLSIIAYLAEFDEFRRNENKAYVKAVSAHFGPHRDHEAVQLARELRQKELIGYNALSGLAAHVDPDFEPIVPLSPRPERLDRRWSNVGRTSGFLAAAARFAEDTDFAAFWEAQQPYVDKVEARFVERLGGKDVVGWFDQTFGPVEGANYRVVPGLLTGQNNYGTSVQLPDGTVSYRPALGMWNLDGDELPRVERSHELVLVHEFGHAYGNPVVEAHLDVLEQWGDALYALDRQAMDQRAYPSGQMVLGETLTRAFTVLYATDRYGKAGGAAQLAEEESAGFVWTSAVTSVLRPARQEGPLDLPALVPSIRDALKAWLADPPVRPYRGNLNQASTGPWASQMVVALPSASTTAGAYGRAMHKQFTAKRGAVVVDAASHDLSESRAVIAYGTPANNPVVAEVLQHYGWTLTDKELRVGPLTYTLEPGDHGVVFIAAVPHPEHPELPVQLYTATSDAAMDNINALFHGPTQWVVGEALPGKGPRALNQGALSEIGVAP